jgi:hypothetical protein
MDIVFYASGHGFGHATRVNAVVEALLAAEPGLEVAVRTRAPAMLFAPRVKHFPVTIDADVVESADALNVDLCATAERTAAFYRDADAFVDAEAAWLRSSGAWLVVTDVAPIAGEVATAAGVPCVAMGNFLWTWILSGAADEATLERMRRGYAACTEVLRMPLSHTEGWDMFPCVIEVPLVAPRSVRPRDEIRAELGCDSRNLVLIGGRARLSPELRSRIARECPEHAFVTADRLPQFSDLVRAADVMVSKIGYSTLAECIAERTPLLYPPRDGFPEEVILRREGPALLPLLPIPRQDWAEGNWAPYLEALAATPFPESAPDVSGAAVIAHRLLRSR